VRLGLDFALPAVIVLLSLDAASASCRGYGREIQSAIKTHVETLRAVEREAADRLSGLDTRPFDYLVGQARVAAAMIADKNGLAEEEDLRRCRNYIPPVRRVCAGAAQALVGLIEERATFAESKARQAYAEAMPRCERWMSLEPLKTVFRVGG
jgi:hypothetical protein